MNVTTLESRCPGTSHRLRTGTLFLALVLALTGAPGCGTTGTDPESTGTRDAPSDEAPGTNTSDADATTGATGPATGETSSPSDEPARASMFHCASEAFTIGTVRAAWRVELTREEDEHGTRWSGQAMRSGSHGPFPEWSDVEEHHVTLPDTVEVDGGVRFEGPEGWIRVDTSHATLTGAWTGVAEFAADGEELSLACWTDGIDAAALTFRYDDATGSCLNAAGEPGLNQIPLPLARETTIGHCGDFRGVFLNEDNLGGPQLDGWDLAGADLSEARLSFADLTDGDFRGADMRTFEFGYAHVVGRVDEHTRIPEGADEPVDGYVEWRN